VKSAGINAFAKFFERKFEIDQFERDHLTKREKSAENFYI